MWEEEKTDMTEAKRRGQRGCRRKGKEKERFEVRKKISKRKINRGQEHCDREQTNHLERGGGKRSAVWCEK